MTISPKEKIIKYITSYYATHPHDTQVTRFFHLISQINDEATLSILWKRMKQSVHHIATHRFETQRKHISETAPVDDADTSEADALLTSAGI